MSYSEQELDRLSKALEKDFKLLQTLKLIHDYHSRVFKCPKCGSSDLERISLLQYKCKQCGSTLIYPSFSPSDFSPNIPFSHVLELVNLGIIEAAHGGSKGISYVLVKPELVKRALENKGFIEEMPKIELPELEGELESEEFFNLISDFRNIVNLILKSVKSGGSAHFLLLGPKISLKSLIIEELTRIPGSYFYVPSADPSLDEVLWSVKPNPLIIPNLDKMRSSVDLSTLVNFISSNRVFVRKVGDVVQHRSTVTASSLSERGIPRDLVSYFITLHLPPIEDEELRRKIVTKLVMERSGKSEKLANYIAGRSSLFSDFGFREFLELAKLCDDEDCVDSVVSLLVKYSKPLEKKRRRSKGQKS